MNKNKKVKTSILQMQTIRLSRAHFFLVGAYAIFVLLLDAWKLATPDTILNRWMLVGFCSRLMQLAGLQQSRRLPVMHTTN